MTEVNLIHRDALTGYAARIIFNIILLFGVGRNLIVRVIASILIYPTTVRVILLICLLVLISFW